MVISEERWIKAIRYAAEQEGTDVYEIKSDGTYVYTDSRNKIKTKNKFEQLVYRFKLEEVLPSGTYNLSIHTRTHKTGRVEKGYLFYLKGKRLFKTDKFRTEKVRLSDALMAAYEFDKNNPDKQERK